MFAGVFAPKGWAFCDGALVKIEDGTAALHYIVGDGYGGDGTTSFALPNLNAALAEGTPKYIICVEGYVPQRD